MPECMDERSLCDYVRCQDRKGFTQLYDSYSPAVYGEILRIVKNKQAAEDLLQEVFITIWLKGHQYDAAKGRLFTWMLSITRNRCIDYLRKPENDPKFFIDENMLTEKEIQPGNKGLEFSMLYKNFGSIGPRHLELVRLVYMYGYTHSEASKKCEIPVGTVKTILRKLISKTRGKYLIS